MQTPEYRVNSLNALGNTPVSTSLAVSGQVVPGMLSNVATFKRDKVPTNSNQTNIQEVYDVYASVQGRDLGGVAADIKKVTTQLQKELKPGNSIQVVGQIQSMNDSFRNLGIGLLFAAVFVYLLMVVNYQTFGDPFVVILALPATLCGIVTMLFITGTTLNVPSLMGAIMAVGVASANSILLVTFAREQQLKGHSAFEAALSAGHTRIRPVLMTAAAMIVGMIPMAIGGAGEEQNAALARAVIGGLLVRDADNVADRALPVRHAAQRQRRKASPWRIRGSSRMTEIRVRPKKEAVQDRADPETDRVVALPNASAPKRRRRYGGALLGASALLLLLGGLGIGGWRHYQAELAVAATAQQIRTAVPDVQRGRGPRQRQQNHRHLARDDDGVRGGEYFRAHQRLHRKALCRHRRSGQGRRPAGGHHRPGARPPDHAGQGDAGPEPGDIAANAGKP